MVQRSRSYELEPEADSTPGLTPDHRLMVAVLIRAVRDFVNYRDAKKGTDEHKLAVDAAGWIFWDGYEPMTFRRICKTVGLDPDNIRRTTLALTRDELLRMSKAAETENEPEEDDFDDED